MSFLDSAHPAGLIIRKIQSKGFHSIVVGGALRDMLLGNTFNDVDVLTNARPDQIMQIFGSQACKLVGKHFPVCLVAGIEVATCRGESEPWFIKDFQMRDLTINAIGFDPVKNEIIDPFNGQKDIEEGRVKFVEEPFARITEDPLRMIRACRFAALINGSIDEESLQAIIGQASCLANKISAERIRIELIKAMSLHHPSLFFRLMMATGLLNEVLPSLSRCHDLDGGPHHGETVFEHCMLTGDALPASRPLLRLSGYLHDVGKFDAKKVLNGIISFHGHEKNINSLEKDLQRLRFSREEQSYILSLILMHMHPLKEETNPVEVRRLLASLELHEVDVMDFMRMRIADKKANLAKAPYSISDIRIRLKKLHTELNRLNGFGINDLAINGDDIAKVMDLQPGPGIGKIKVLLLEEILEKPELNTKALLLGYLFDLKQQVKFNKFKEI